MALPFVRSPLPAAAIAVGAMTPDLPLFVRGTFLTYGSTHAFEMLWLTVPVAFLLLMVWYVVLRPATRELLPVVIAERLPAEWDAGTRDALSAVLPTLRRAAWLVLALAIGVASHIVWDLFTHEERWGSALLPALDEAWGPFPGYRWLQYLSSVVGLTILAVWGARWCSRATPQAITRVLPDSVRWLWWLSLPAALALGWGIGLALHGPLDGDFGVRHLAYLVLPVAAAAWGAGTCVLCIAIQVRRGAAKGRKDARHARDAP